ncbi:PREDICTED: phosphomevalonate kinase [Wasmannia auropunctata]|uniref:phosphomevalonate kinase n=1 Tax=Wasmannia auropunctata TaxID=64793 RepID=UPI0005EDD8ED|nr:PREDICTED: phosphomevalonate kinase [Wasmannia auropunctata]
MATEQTLEARDVTKIANNSPKPERILLFSGKRKSGKDYITDILHNRIGSERSTIIRLSGPIKTHWAKSRGLDLDQLLGHGEYKEKYRLEMAKWGEDVRRKDYGYFCHAAIDMYNAWDKAVWIISDVRRKTDVKWFAENFGDVCKTVRIACPEEVRQKRGWVHTPGIDDSETECDLDDMSNWDVVLENNDDSDVEAILQRLLDLVS